MGEQIWEGTRSAQSWRSIVSEYFEWKSEQITILNGIEFRSNQVVVAHAKGLALGRQKETDLQSKCQDSKDYIYVKQGVKGSVWKIRYLCHWVYTYKH